MGFHSNANRMVLTARTLAYKIKRTMAFDGHRMVLWSTSAVFIFTMVRLWQDPSVSFSANPVAYGTRFQAEFVRALFCMVVVIVAAALVYHGSYTILALASLAPVTCSNDTLEKIADDGNWAAALELAKRFSADPVHRNFWERKARQLGYES